MQLQTTMLLSEHLHRLHHPCLSLPAQKKRTPVAPLHSLIDHCHCFFPSEAMAKLRVLTQLGVEKRIPGGRPFPHPSRQVLASRGQLSPAHGARFLVNPVDLRSLPAEWMRNQRYTSNPSHPLDLSHWREPGHTFHRRRVVDGLLSWRREDSVQTFPDKETKQKKTNQSFTNEIFFSYDSGAIER